MKYFAVIIIFLIISCSSNETNNRQKANVDMEEGIYGIDKTHAHARAIELVPEEFFWDCTDEIAPFGSDEGDVALYEYRDWRKDNPNAPLMKCLIWTIESVGEMKFKDYNETLLSPDLIREQIKSFSFDDHQYIFTLDISVVGTGFGQLVDEGKIDDDVKPIIAIAINRLIIWSELHTSWEHSNQFITNLNVLKRVLKDA